ncbi:hypothetical protein ACQPZQ_04740 [Pseudonocardia sp. CA-142604]|uniref:hypothetical protein n=1 Tax=Pseudonocardia sp. CA-142604 TaxID=3240024 RepID=UPI003D8FB2E0
MLKKAGIVVAAATAGLLAVAPLAFAADRGDSDNGPRGGDSSTSSTVGFFDIDSEYDGADCAYDNTAETANTNDGTGTVLAILGVATNALTQGFAPVTAPVQAGAPVGSCNNLTFEDNRQDDDSTVTDSFNQSAPVTAPLGG